MARNFLLIDGYNLMHGAGMARPSYGPGDLARCRGRLLKFLLAKLTLPERKHTTIVFDARDPPPGRATHYRVGDLLVLFAIPHGDADVILEELIAAHSAPKQITLVSSDHRLQSAAARRKAAFVDSDIFFDQLASRSAAAADQTASDPNSQADPKQGGDISAQERDYWLSVFGDVAEIQQPSDHQEQQTDLPEVIDEEWLDIDKKDWFEDDR